MMRGLRSAVAVVSVISLAAVLAACTGAAQPASVAPTADVDATVAAAVEATQASIAVPPATAIPKPTVEPVATRGAEADASETPSIPKPPSPKSTPAPSPTPGAPATPKPTPTPGSKPALPPGPRPTPTGEPARQPKPAPTAKPRPVPTPALPPLPSPTPPPTPAPPVEDDWVIPEGTGTMWRAAHMGGNWGTTRDAVAELPNDYFEFLRDLDVNWVGISVTLHVDDSMDSTVELDYSEHRFTPTFPDDVLARMIRKFRKHGFNVYMHVDLSGGAEADRPMQRWQIGDPAAATYDDSILPENWPWALDHPDHDRFVSEFWQTYAEQVVHLGRIAEAEDVGMLTLGTEMDRLFRTRSGGEWPNHFLNEITAMVEAVRAVYSGTLAYEQHSSTTSQPGYFGPAVGYLVDDLGLDVIAVSAYYELWPEPPSAVPGVLDLEGSWERIFSEYLIPLQERNGGRPILFTEFGYTDSVRSLIQADIDSFIDKVFADRDGNGLDDGEETQANAYEAFFNVVDRYPGVVEGAFLWGHQMSTDEVWKQGFGRMRTFSVRDKLAEEIVRSRYAEWGGLTHTPAPTATPVPTAVPTPAAPAAPGDEVVRLYYYGHEMTPGLDPAAIAGPHSIYSATSSDGITFTEDPGVRFSHDTHSEFGITDPDVVRLNDGTWLMFVSLGSNLLKGTSPTSDGTFTYDASFEWRQGGVAASHNFHGDIRTFVSHENGINTAAYDQTTGNLTPTGAAAIFPPPDGAAGSPSVIEIGDRYRMAYLYRPIGVTDPREHEIYMAESVDGMAWSQHADNVYIGNGSVPGAVYFNDTIFVYYCGGASLASGAPQGDLGVAISRDGGATFEHSRITIGGRALSGVVDPAAIVVSASGP